jgi:hypothetical protein
VDGVSTLTCFASYRGSSGPELIISLHTPAAEGRRVTSSLIQMTQRGDKNRTPRPATGRAEMPLSNRPPKAGRLPPHADKTGPKPRPGLEHVTWSYPRPVRERAQTTVWTLTKLGCYSQNCADRNVYVSSMANIPSG